MEELVSTCWRSFINLLQDQVTRKQDLMSTELQEKFLEKWCSWIGVIDDLNLEPSWERPPYVVLNMPAMQLRFGNDEFVHCENVNLEIHPSHLDKWSTKQTGDQIRFFGKFESSSFPLFDGMMGNFHINSLTHGNLEGLDESIAKWKSDVPIRQLLAVYPNNNYYDTTIDIRWSTTRPSNSNHFFGKLDCSGIDLPACIYSFWEKVFTLESELIEARCVRVDLSTTPGNSILLAEISRSYLDEVICSVEFQSTSLANDLYYPLLARTGMNDDRMIILNELGQFIFEPILSRPYLSKKLSKLIAQNNELRWFFTIDSDTNQGVELDFRGA